MENALRCMMCCVRCASNDDLTKHIARYHQFDPQFQVQCKYDGCGVTFSKWKSFRQHVWRKHGNNIRADESMVAEIDYINENDDLIREEHNAVNNDTEENVESTMTAIEKIQGHAVKLLLNIRENCKISQTAMETIIDGIQYYVNMTTSIIMNELFQLKDPNTNTIDFEIVQNLFTDQYSSAAIFSTMDTKKKFDAILEKKFNMIPPHEVLLYKELVWKRTKQGVPDLQEVSRFGYIIPFLKNLKVLLSNNDIRNNIDNQGGYNGSWYKTVLDGEIYRENNFFKNNPNALGIILYYDDLGVASPLGVSAKAQKISVFYWSIANIDPRFRYSKYAIQLLAIAKTEWLKKKGALSKLLEPFIQDIIMLKTDGITINVNDNDQKIYKGSLLFCSGDTPASAQLGGFKESPSAYRLCRHCMITQDEWKIMFSTQNLILRNKASHDDHITAILLPDLSTSDRNFWSRRYGVNSKSPLLDIADFDVTKSLPQDAMHILIEGVVGVACKELLSFLINVKRSFTVNEFNCWRENFNYYGHLKRDMPAIVLEEHLADNGQLRQNASQMFVLAHMLPFIIANYVIDTEDDEINQKLFLHVLLLKILNALLAYQIHEDTLVLLEPFIETYVRIFNGIYPNCLIPKFHFLLHILQDIRLFGPARQQWCFRYESAHAYFKSLAPIIRNFKNMAYSLMYRHQSNLCSALVTYPNTESKKILYQGHKIACGVSVLLNDLPNSQLLHRFIPIADRLNCKLLKTPKVEIYGTVFKPNSFILLECVNYSLPQFGRIDEIFVFGEQIFFIFSYYLTTYFHLKLNAYHVEQFLDNLKGTIRFEDLIFPHPLINVKIGNLEFISLLNHESDIYNAITL